MDHAAAAVCPACHADYAPDETVCPCCGLVFTTFDPHATRPLNLLPGDSTAPSGVTQSYQPLAAGQTLARQRYTIQRLLSRGGMGTVYLATDHTAFDRTVVLKAMLDYFDPNNPQEVEAARHRFLQEARTLASLRHPTIPQIYSYFQDGPHNYIVMEYIEGRDLEQHLTRFDDTSGKLLPGQPYPLEQVLRWGITLCRVLEYLASRQPPVVHHDIKPTNLLLDQHSDEVRLVDFGTARTHLLAQNGGVGRHTSHVYGTRGYAAPEQYRGESEPRSDVYVLAATLYHLATDDDPCQHPFDFPHLPKLGRFGEILQAALLLDVTQRPDAATLRQHLEELTATPVRTTLTAPDGTAIATVADLVDWCEQHWSLASDWLYNRMQQSLPDQIEVWWGQTKLALELRTITLDHQNQEAGLDVALAWLDPDGYGQATPHLRADTQTIDLGKPSSHPQGYTVTITNSGRRVVLAGLEKPAWLFITSSSITSSMFANRVRRMLTLPPGQSTSLALLLEPAAIRFGGRLRGRITLCQQPTTLLEIPVSATVPPCQLLLKRILRPAVILTLLGVGLVGSIVYTMVNRNASTYLARQQAAFTVDLPTPTATLPPATPTASMLHGTIGSFRIPLANSVQPGSVLATQAGAVRNLAFFPDGQRFVSGHQQAIKLWQMHDLRPELILTHFTAFTDTLALSPDGQMLVASNPEQVTIWQIQGDSLRKIFTQNDESIQTTAFSPDSQMLLTGNAHGIIKLWRIPDKQLLLSLDHGHSVNSVAFSLDGAYIASGGGSQVKLWNVQDGWPLRVLNGKNYQTPIAFAAYDKTLAMVTSNGSLMYWYVHDSWSNPPEYSSGNGPKQRYNPRYLTFSPDATLLAVGNANVIELWDVAKDASIQIINQPAGEILSLAFSPDRHTLAIGDSAGNITFWPVQP